MLPCFMLQQIALIDCLMVAFFAYETFLTKIEDSCGNLISRQDVFDLYRLCGDLGWSGLYCNGDLR